jgi:hypothetical protein
MYNFCKGLSHVLCRKSSNLSTSVGQRHRWVKGQNLCLVKWLGNQRDKQYSLLYKLSIRGTILLMWHMWLYEENYLKLILLHLFYWNLHVNQIKYVPPPPCRRQGKGSYSSYSFFSSALDVRVVSVKPRPRFNSDNGPMEPIE